MQQLEMVDEFLAACPIERLTKQEKGTFFGLYELTFFPWLLPGKSDNEIVEARNRKGKVILSAELVSTQNGGIARAAGKTPGTPLTKGDFRRYCEKTFNVKLPDGLKFN